MDIEHLCYEQGAAKVLTVNSQRNLGLPMLESSKVDAAILDARIGEKWTNEFARHLLKRNIPFVFASGYSRFDPFFAEFSDIPVVGKPFAGADLAQALSAAIGRMRSGNC